MARKLALFVGSGRRWPTVLIHTRARTRTRINIHIRTHTVSRVSRPCWLIRIALLAIIGAAHYPPMWTSK